MRLFNRRGGLPGRTLGQYIHSIRFKLVLWFVLILGVVMVIFSVFVYWRQALDIRSIAQARLNYIVERYLGPTHEGEDVNEEPHTTSPALLGTILGSTVETMEEHVVAIAAPDGTIIQSTGVLSADQLKKLNLQPAGWYGTRQVTVPKTPGVETTRFIFTSQPITQNGKLGGYFLAGVPLDAEHQLGRLLISLVIGNLLTLLIALSGGFLLADQAMRPVHTITQTARQISETDLNRRLHLPGRDELSELASTFDAMLDRLQVAFERQRQFTADASHELRTPLTIIDLEASRALENRRSVEEYERILTTIKSENQFMVRLVNNLLALARMDAGQLNIKSEPVELGDLVLEIVERMRPLADAQGVQILVSDVPELPIQGDQPTLVQMLTNLVENAIKYSTGATHPQVEISAGKREQIGQWVAWVRISDNGIGISEAHLAHIFDRFYQVEASRSHLADQLNDKNEPGSSGTGLGLAIAQWIVHAHRGEIRVESTPGRGSMFEVTLPLLINER